MDKITSLFTESQLKKGDFFTKSGQYCEKLSFVRSGFIRIFANTNDKDTKNGFEQMNKELKELAEKH